MKISPLSAGGTPGQALGGVEVGRTANNVKMEKARAIARGEAAPEQVEEEERKPLNARKITMRTNRSPMREELEEIAAAAEAPEPVSTTPESSEQATIEETKPLSPQFAALAKQKRALQLERAQLDKEKAEMAAKGSQEGSQAIIERLKSKPLSVLQEHGVTYDQLTEAILNDDGGNSAELKELKEKLASLEKGFDEKLSARDQQAEQAALAEMRREAERLAKDGDTFELVRETKSYAQVTDLIHRIYKQSGEVLDVSEAMQLVEDELIADSMKLASLKKVQSRITPPPAAPLQPQQRQMRTLTARDGSSAPMSAKARAMAAFNGTLKR